MPWIKFVSGLYSREVCHKRQHLALCEQQPPHPGPLPPGEGQGEGQASTPLHCLLKRLSEIGTLVPNC